MEIKINNLNFRVLFHPKIGILCACQTEKTLKSLNNIIIKDDIIIDLDSRNNLIGMEMMIPRKHLKVKDIKLNFKTTNIKKNTSIKIPDEYPQKDIDSVEFTGNLDFSKCYIKISKSLEANHIIESNNSTVFWELDKEKNLTGIYLMQIEQNQSCN